MENISLLKTAKDAEGKFTQIGPKNTTNAILIIFYLLYLQMAKFDQKENNEYTALRARYECSDIKITLNVGSRKLAQDICAGRRVQLGGKKIGD